MLVDALGRAPRRRLGALERVTESTVLGPFYLVRVPQRDYGATIAD